MSAAKIHHIDCGTMCPLGASLIGSEGHFWNRGVFACHCLLVETEQGLVLIDTGLGTADLGEDSRLPKDFKWFVKPVDDGPTALSNVLSLGYTASDVRHLLPTHLDLDHAGGMVDFPEATVHLYERELDAATDPPRTEKARYVPAQWGHDPKWQLYPDPEGDSWFGFEAVRPITELGDDLAIVPLAGHSPGHCAIAVRAQDGWVLHAGDAFFHRSELQPGGKAPWGIRMFQRYADSDRKLRMQNSERLRELHANHESEVTVICSHDPVLLQECQQRVSKGS
jgi:glyoxylase-like metal-dependent hydrolase (beta-lactamase superfamily II)